MSRGSAVEIDRIIKGALETKRGDLKTQYSLENKHQVWRRWSGRYRQRAGESNTEYEARLRRKDRLYKLKSQLRKKRTETDAEYAKRVSDIKREIEELEDAEEEDKMWNYSQPRSRRPGAYYVRGNSRPLRPPSNVQMPVSGETGFIKVDPVRPPNIKVDPPGLPPQPLPVASNPAEIPRPPITTKTILAKPVPMQPEIEETKGPVEELETKDDPLPTREENIANTFYTYDDLAEMGWDNEDEINEYFEYDPETDLYKEKDDN